jgi:hypothetical protein
LVRWKRGFQLSAAGKTLKSIQCINELRLYFDEGDSMICRYKLQDALLEARQKENDHLAFKMPFPTPVPKHFKHGTSRANKRTIETPKLPSWFEKASQGWAKVTLADTHTHRLLYTLTQILVVRGLQGRTDRHCGVNEHMRRFSIWFQSLQKDTDAFHSLVFFHLASREFLMPETDNILADPRLDGLLSLFVELTDELSQEDEENSDYFSYIENGWLHCSEDLKEEIHQALSFILNVKAREELLDIHLAMGFSVDSTEKQLSALQLNCQA